MKCLLLILALMVPQMATARIGETRESCKKLYGEDTDPFGEDGDTGTYLYKGYKVMVDYQDKKCWKVIYRKFDHAEMSNADIKELVELSKGPAREWTQVSNNDVSRIWKAFGIYAEYVKREKSLILWTSSGEKRDARKKEDESKDPFGRKLNAHEEREARFLGKKGEPKDPFGRRLNTHEEREARFREFRE